MKLKIHIQRQRLKSSAAAALIEYMVICAFFVITMFAAIPSVGLEAEAVFRDFWDLGLPTCAGHGSSKKKCRVDRDLNPSQIADPSYPDITDAGYF